MILKQNLCAKTSIDGITLRNHILLSVWKHMQIFSSNYFPTRADIRLDHHFQELRQHRSLCCTDMDIDSRPRSPHILKFMTWCICTLHLKICVSHAAWLSILPSEYSLSIQMLEISLRANLSGRALRHKDRFLCMNLDYLDWAFSSLGKVITHSYLSSSSLLWDLSTDSSGQQKGWLRTSSQCSESLQ